MDNFFTFRLDSLTRNKLKILAKQTQRSRGGVIRWLIIKANIQKDIVSPTVGDLSEIIDHLSPVEDEKGGG